MMGYVFLFLFVAAAVAIVAFGVRRVTVMEYEKGLRYVRGRFSSVLEPDQYWYMPIFTMIQKVDIRPQFVSISGQEILSSDGVTLKVSLAANFEVADPFTAVNKVSNYREALYLELQLAVRELLGAADIEAVLSSRPELSTQLLEKTAGKANELGLRLISVNLKDIMFPGSLKDIFAQVVNARKEGQAALEKARGETAALRNLANAAKMLEGNPNLMQLRILHALGETGGNTVVLGAPAQSVPVPVRTSAPSKKTKKKAPKDPE